MRVYQVESPYFTQGSVNIYGLVDPRTGQVRYVGKTKGALSKRFSYHYRRSLDGRDKSRKAAWIKSLDAEGLKPEIFLLEIVSKEYWQEAERDWIAAIDNLTNHTLGGEVGALGWRASSEQKKRRSDSAKRRCEDPAERERLRSISNGTPPIMSGESNPMSKLSNIQVAEIRKLAAAGRSPRELASRYATTRATVSNIVTGKTRADVGGPVRAANQKQKLSDKQVQEIRDLLAEGQTQISIARRFGVVSSHISGIANGKARRSSKEKIKLA